MEGIVKKVAVVVVVVVDVVEVVMEDIVKTLETSARDTLRHPFPLTDIAAPWQKKNNG